MSGQRLGRIYHEICVAEAPRSKTGLAMAEGPHG